MDNLIYLTLMAGSYSIGYGLIRAGFPKVQKKSFIVKIASGYIAGLLLFGLSFLIIDTLKVLDIYYVIICIILYFILFLLLILKRTIFNETDEITPEERLYEGINTESKISTFTKPENFSNLIKDDKVKEELPTKNINPDIANRITFDQGLMVKSRNNEDQIFRGEDTNIIGKVQKETTNLETTQNEEQKNSVLEKLRGYAQEIKVTKKEEMLKKKMKEDDEVESERDLINMLKEE